jgi:hypothetical protein
MSPISGKMGTVTEGKALSKRKPILRGTEGSNPAPSREESSANLSFPAPSRRLQVQRNAHAENARIVDADCVVTTENR